MSRSRVVALECPNCGKQKVASQLCSCGSADFRHEHESCWFRCRNCGVVAKPDIHSALCPACSFNLWGHKEGEPTDEGMKRLKREIDDAKTHIVQTYAELGRAWDLLQPQHDDTGHEQLKAAMEILKESGYIKSDQTDEEDDSGEDE